MSTQQAEEPRADSISERLRRLEALLAAARPAPDPQTREAAESLLSSVMTDRISRIASELARWQTARVDAADVLTMRVLLAEYGAAVRHLRAVASITEQRLSAAATAIKESTRLLGRHTQRS
jgi:hypothetical protein